MDTPTLMSHGLECKFGNEWIYRIMQFRRSKPYCENIAHQLAQDNAKNYTNTQARLGLGKHQNFAPLFISKCTMFY